ncbi:MAG: hypothetical protein HYR85_08105 [Planctomycetes bacterium]|nr:hypothetical protein [Planctomycetota bacterium]MBI3848202.1 hypothetical protein [Planctomycetota bacterium]
MRVRTLDDGFGWIIGCGTTGRTPLGPATTGRDKLSWARLLRKLLEVDPLVCGRCGARMRVIAVITDLRIVDEILGLDADTLQTANLRCRPIDLTERCL